MRSTAPWAGEAAYHTTIAREAAKVRARQHSCLCVRCPVCPYSATGGMNSVGDPCPNDCGGVLVVDDRRVPETLTREEAEKRLRALPGVNQDAINAWLNIPGTALKALAPTAAGDILRAYIRRLDAQPSEQAPVDEATELRSILGIALVGLRTAVEKYSADDQVLVNVQAGLRELGLNPDRMHDDALRPESAEGL